MNFNITPEAAEAIAQKYQLKPAQVRENFNELVASFIMQAKLVREDALWARYRLNGAVYGDTVEGASQWYTEDPSRQPPESPPVILELGRGYAVRIFATRIEVVDPTLVPKMDYYPDWGKKTYNVLEKLLQGWVIYVYRGGNRRPEMFDPQFRTRQTFTVRPTDIQRLVERKLVDASAGPDGTRYQIKKSPLA